LADVLWVTPGYPWAGQPSGGLFYRTQARALARRGLRVTVAASVPFAPWPLRAVNAKWAAYSRAPRDTEEAGVRVIRPRYVNVPRQPRWAAADRLIARAVLRQRDAWSGAQVIHAHTAVEAIAGWRLAQRTGLPLVITFHGSDINTWPANHADRLPEYLEAIRGAAAVIAVSGALAERIEALAGVRPHTLPLGVDHAALAAARLDRDAARQQLGLPADAVVALFIGNLLPAKGIREFADGVLAAGGGVLGVAVGGGPERGYGTASPGGERLRYAGERPHDEMAAYLSAADMLLLPSYGEGLPTVLVEAGSLEVPVIASAVGGIPALLADGRGTLLSTPSAGAVAEAIRGAIADPAAARASAAALHAHVLAEYDVDVNAGALVDVYRAAGARF
jgi:teichuronic acid biosynthesis glycosyltransferase TuaC